MNIREAMKLYVIPDRRIGEPRSLIEQAEAALLGGATAIQLRDKTSSGREIFEIACAMRDLCSRHEALFIVNDRLDVALAAGADGVHLGQLDLPLKAARRIVPKNFVIGVSARDMESLRRAERDGADYLGVGAAFPTGSKDDARVIGVEMVGRIAAATSLPMVGIGGVCLENVEDLISVGVDGVAVISAVVGQPDIRTSAERIRSLIR